MFEEITAQLTTIAQDAWLFLVGLIIIVALLGGLYLVLQGTAGAAFGGARTTAVAMIGVFGLVVMVLVAFLVLPQLGELLQGLTPDPPF